MDWETHSSRVTLFLHLTVWLSLSLHTCVFRGYTDSAMPGKGRT